MFRGHNAERDTRPLQTPSLLQLHWKEAGIYSLATEECAGYQGHLLSCRVRTTVSQKALHLSIQSPHTQTLQRRAMSGSFVAPRERDGGKVSSYAGQVTGTSTRGHIPGPLLSAIYHRPFCMLERYSHFPRLYSAAPTYTHSNSAY